MSKSATKLDWLEELLLMYEFTYGHGKIRLTDYTEAYKINKRTLKKAIMYRLKRELECRKRWPMYCSYKEDADLRNGDKWNGHFNPVNGPRVVMHDTTNIELQQPSSGDMQRALHNKYYSMTCAKAGVAVQLCNWIYGLPLVTGHSSDDQQIEQTNVLNLQKTFAEMILLVVRLYHF